MVPRLRLPLVLVAACASSTPPSPKPEPARPVTIDAAPAADEVEVIAEPNRPLTTGEIALLEPIFRDGIDYKRIRVIDNSFPLQPANVYMTPRGHVYAPGKLFQVDFSKTGVHLRAVFVHEVMHIWQHTNGMDLIQQGVIELVKHGAYEKAYPYQLESGRDLVEYGMEQQASIVEDYFTITVDRQLPHRITNKGLSDTDRDALYAAVLAKFLRNARYAQSLDAKRVGEQHAKSSERTAPGPSACKESEQEHGASHMCEWRYQPKKPPQR
jgi:hypothetical protein